MCGLFARSAPQLIVSESAPAFDNNSPQTP
jgi:hypothetical protein